MRPEKSAIQSAAGTPGERSLAGVGAQTPLIWLSLLLAPSLVTLPARAQKPAPVISGQAIYSLTQQVLAVAPKRFNDSPGHLAAENFIKEHFKPEAAKGNFETDQFTGNTPVGPQVMRNYIVCYPGRKDGVIVRDQLPAQGRQLRRRKRRSLHLRPAHRPRPIPPHTSARGLLRLARLRRRRRGHCEPALQP
jgi:hypothetical protein